MGNKQYRFDFSSVEKPFESYEGLNVRLRYFIRVTITRNYGVIAKEFDYIVQNIQAEKDTSSTLKMEVGIEDCLHIEFEYDKGGQLSALI
jgi:vacuolar protein sorting-associated protein 26